MNWVFTFLQLGFYLSQMKHLILICLIVLTCAKKERLKIIDSDPIDDDLKNMPIKVVKKCLFKVLNKNPLVSQSSLARILNVGNTPKAQKIAKNITSQDDCYNCYHDCKCSRPDFCCQVVDEFAKQNPVLNDAKIVDAVQFLNAPQNAKIK